MAGVVDDELVGAAAIDKGLNGLEDSGGVDGAAVGVSDEAGVGWVSHPLADGPLVHAPGAGGRVIKRLEVASAIDADEDAGSDHGYARERELPRRVADRAQNMRREGPGRKEPFRGC